MAFALPVELQETQKKWIQAGSFQEKELVYALEFGPGFAPLFAAQSLRNAPPSLANKRPRALISILGHSWQAVALMAAWSNAECIQVIATHESLRTLNLNGGRVVQVIDLIAEVSGIPRQRLMAPLIVNDPGELQIYQGIHRFVKERGFGHQEVYIDPTGGKKTMSIPAALAGFLIGAPLVYVDSDEYDRGNPIAGTEYPRLIANPLEEFGDLVFRQIEVDFDNGNFTEAARRARELGERLYDRRIAEAYANIAEAYQAWKSRNFILAFKRLEETRRAYEQFGHYDEKWDVLRVHAGRIEDHLALLARLQAAAANPQSNDEGMPHIFNRLCAARRALAAAEYSLTVLLTYGAIEHYLRAHFRGVFGLDPDMLAGLKDRGDFVLAHFHDLGRRLFISPPYQERPLERVAYACGLHLYSVLRLASRPPLDQDAFLGKIRRLLELGNLRNQCEFAHGDGTVDYPKSKKYFDSACDFIADSIEMPMDKFKAELSRYDFPKFSRRA